MNGIAPPHPEWVRTDRLSRRRFPSKRRGGWFAGLAVLLLSLVQVSEAASPIQFEDVTARTGISFVHSHGGSGERYIVETVAAGLALFDFDNDGYTDIYFLNGAPLKGTESGETLRNSLWRNNGDWTFTDVTESSGLGDGGYGLGVAAADYNNSGFQDVFISNFGTNVLYRNNGDGTFTDVTAEAGLASDLERVGAGAAFLDMNNNGHLDLFVAYYVDFNYDNHRIVRFNGHPAYVGPLDYQPIAGALYRNNGDGSFTDVSLESGIAAHKGAGMGVICFDYNRNGFTDILVGNDMAANFLFVNDGTGKFREMGVLAGLGYDFAGRAQGTMGVEVGDVNNNGWMDVYVTSYQQELVTLYENDGGFFEDVTHRTGAGEGTLRHVTWGVGMVDFDNDGHRDLFVASGHLHDNVHLFDQTTSYRSPNSVLRNLGNGKFSNISNQAGPGMQVLESSRGAAFDDLDNNGLIDAVILNSNAAPTILRNVSPRGNNWLQVRLAGTQSNRDGVGARVTVKAGDLTLADEMRSGRGYQSDYGKRLHFGLGKQKQADRIEVRWPGGRADVLENVPPNQIITIREGGPATE